MGEDGGGAKWVRGVCIGRGSFGRVSLAMKKPDGEIFAVKSVNGLEVLQWEALENEIEVLRSLDCPYIVRYLGDDTTADPKGGWCRNLHMEYVPGGTLAEVAARRELDDRQIRLHTRSLLRALEYLHDRGIVHGDVKGRNVLVGPTGAKLADFGSAQHAGGQGWARGTPLWMAPEVARGEQQSAAAEVWSLGCTVVEMAAGRAPWGEDCAGRTTAEAIWRIGFSNESPKFPVQLSPEGLDFLDKCLSREPAERWTCKQLLQHPFLVHVGATEQSPRSVFDRIDAGFVGEEEKTLPSSSSGFNEDALVISDAKSRIRQLACRRFIGWESAGWEMVRGEGSIGRRKEMGLESASSNSRNNADEGERARGCEYCYCNCCNCRAALCCQLRGGKSYSIMCNNLYSAWKLSSILTYLECGYHLKLIANKHQKICCESTSFLLVCWKLKQ